MSSKETQAMVATCTYKAQVLDVEVLKYETRCPHPRCKKILFKGILAPGSMIEVLCQGCRKMTILKVVPSQ
jgi:hypothetical protein